MKKKEEIIVAKLFNNIALFFLGCILLMGFVSCFPETMPFFSVPQVVLLLSWSIFCVSRGYLHLTKK